MHYIPACLCAANKSTPPPALSRTLYVNDKQVWEWLRAQLVQGVPTAQGLPPPGATHADGTPRTQANMAEVFLRCGRRGALRDQAVGTAYMQEGIEATQERRAAEAAPATATANTQGKQAGSVFLHPHFVDTPPPAATPAPEAASPVPPQVDLSLFDGWAPPLATVEGVGGIPFTTTTPEVPRMTEFKELSDI